LIILIVKQTETNKILITYARMNTILKPFPGVLKKLLKKYTYQITDIPYKILKKIKKNPGLSKKLVSLSPK